MADILCIGHSAYDITLPMKDFPVENNKYGTNLKIEGGGGPAANAAYLLSKWGLDTTYIGLLGDDIYGKKIMAEFKSVGTDVSLVKIEQNYPTPYSVILVNTTNGSRTIINCKENHDGIDVCKSKLKKVNPKIILFDGHELKLSLKALELFPKAISVLDAGSVREGTIALAKKVDYLITSENFALSYCHMDSLSCEEDYKECIIKLKNLSKGQIVVTLGERGLIYEEEGDVKSLAAYKAKAIDTTGAGDIFHGAFTYGLYKGYSLLDNLRFSSKVSALSVEKLGGRQSIPDLTPILESFDM